MNSTNNISMDNELKKLYDEYWPKYQTHIRSSEIGKEAAFPFLIRCPDSYEMAPKKIMFCGQETLNWYKEGYDNPEVDYHKIRGIYNAFVNTNHGNNSPYWNFQKRIRNTFPKIGYINNNIVKIGKKYSPGCDDRINDLALKYFPVIRREIEILKPDLIIFFTGPNYDFRIKKALGEFYTEHLDKKFECWDRIKFQDTSLPSAIRLNHPAWIVRNKINDVSLYKQMSEAVCSYIKHFYA